MFRAGFLVFHVDANALSTLDNTFSIPNTRRDAMDIDGPSSSPPLRHTSLPPSSAPQPSASSNSRNGTPRRARPVADALAFGDGDEEGADVEQENGPRRRARPRQMNPDVPLVKDAVGESVRESFETFLRT